MNAEILLPASKSISNRVLIIRALSGSIDPIINLSKALDTQDLVRCLQSNETKIHVGEGATTLRFLLAYFAITQRKVVLHGGPSLQKRPHKVLLEILEELGCRFRYFEVEYQLPLEIVRGIQENYFQKIIIDASMSSQFVSSLLLISPYLQKGLQLHYTEGLVSEPYIQMTKKLMLEFGVELAVENHSIQIQKSKYQFRNYFVEADWSAACFFYAFLGLVDFNTFYFPDLRISGLQGDEILIDFFKRFGIETIPEVRGIKISKQKMEPPDFVEFDFTNFPDLFPPISIFCAITKTNARFKGLQHLVFKESNRLKVISDFLKSQNVKIQHHETGSGDLTADFYMSDFNENIPETYSSFNDHRIAMSFSLFNTIKKIKVFNPEVVQKSFPGFWDQLNKIVS